MPDRQLSPPGPPHSRRLADDRPGPSHGPRGLHDDRRGVTPAVAKTLEIGMVVLFVALVTSVLLGGAVPDYRTATGDELGERVLVTAAGEIERAVPPAGRDVTARRSVDLPGTIAGSDYYVRLDGRRLVLDHPSRDIEGEVRLVLPERVDRVEGHWQSGAETVVRVTDGPDGLVVELRNGGGAG